MRLLRPELFRDGPAWPACWPPAPGAFPLPAPSKSSSSSSLLKSEHSLVLSVSEYMSISTILKWGVLLCDVMGLLRVQLSRKMCTMHNSFTFFNRIATSYEYLMHIAKRIWASSRNCICNLTNPLHWVFFFITKYSYSNMKMSHRAFYWVKNQFFRTWFGQ